MLSNLYNVLVVGNQKAIVGFVVTFLATYIAQVGLSLDMTLAEVIKSVAGGVITGAGVWLKANSTK